MTKLHEILAVEGSVQGASKEIIKETENTFSNKATHFKGFVKEYKPFDEDEAEAEGYQEKNEMVSTVDQKLEHFWDVVSNELDVTFKKESTNQEAKGDIIVEGKFLKTGVPIGYLLGLEQKIKDWRRVLKAIPTLQPGIKWNEDEKSGKGVWETKPEPTFRTRKEVRFKVLIQATDKHPAQVEKWHEQVNVGKFHTTVWSGEYSTAQKAELLKRLDRLEHGVKKARMRANSIEIVDVEIASEIKNYLTNGV